MRPNILSGRYTHSLPFTGRIHHGRWFKGLPICVAKPPKSFSGPSLTCLVQGGRLVAERRMVTDIYMFDIETSTWEKIPQSPDSDQPRARYFHSTDACESPNLTHHTYFQSLTTFSHSEFQGITTWSSSEGWLSSQTLPIPKSCVS